MKTLIAIIFTMLIASGAFAQADRIAQTDSVKSGDISASFTVNSRHNYNTFMLKSLVATDSVKAFVVNESGDTTSVCLRSLSTNSDLPGNLITGYTGNQEFLVLHPNIYKLVITYVKATISKTIIIRRRGNNLK
jgi:hypothetical protein